MQLRLKTSHFFNLSRPSWYTVRCIHTSQRCISSWQVTDNIFEIETTALAHVACAPQQSGVLLTDFSLHIRVSITPGSSLCLRTLGCLAFSVASCDGFIRTAPHTWNLREQNEYNSLWPEKYYKVVLRVVSFFAMAFRPYLQMAPRNYYPTDLRQLGFLATCTLRFR